MKVIGISGSPRPDGNTATLVEQALAGAEEKGAQTAFFCLNSMELRGCQGCMYCRKHETCRVRDDMRMLLDALYEADGLVFGSPIYMGQMSGQAKAFMDRLFCTLNPDLSSRFTARKQLALVFCQGGTAEGALHAYAEHTSRVFQHLGFNAPALVCAGGVNAAGDVLQKKELMEKARAAGRGLMKR